MSSISILEAFGACYDAREWVEARPDQSPNALWRECPRADWLAWYLGSLGERDGRGSPAHRRAVLVACLCARTTSAHWRDPACEAAASLAERWAWGDDGVTWGDDGVTFGELRAYAHASYYATAAAGAAVYYAASADADAADAIRHDLCALIRAAIPEVPL